MIRWGIMSTGTIAKKFAQTLTSMDEQVVFAGVASRDATKAKAFAETYGAKTFFNSHEEMINSKDIDAIYVATPNKYHFEHVMLCLNGGKHVLCEKPFTTNAEDARKLYDAAKSKGLFLMDGLWTMHLPMYTKIREIIEGGVIGEVKHLRADYGFIATGARLDMKMDSSLGGGSLLDVGIYNIGFAAMVLGTNPASIQAHLSICDAGTDDLAAVLLTYPSGQTACLTSAIGVKMPTEGVIFGTKGRLHLPNFQGATHMTMHPNEGDVVEFEIPYQVNGFEYQIEAFADCIAKGQAESSRISADFSIGLMQMLDDIRKAGGMRFSFEN